MLPPSDPHRLGLLVDQIRRNGWIPIPLAYRSKHPVPGTRWKGRNFTGLRFEATALREGPLGIGLRLDDLVVIDIDADDPFEVERIVALAMAILGQTPAIRVGRAPRRQMIYRAPPGGVDPWREHSIVECLTGEGAYVVGFNLHPDTGRPFEWIGEDAPQDLPVDRLPVIGNEALAAFRGAVLRRPCVSASPTQSATLTGPKAAPARSGRVADGRDRLMVGLVAFAIGRAKGESRPLCRQDLIREIWDSFCRAADLNRPKGSGRGPWSIQDVERKVDYALRPSRSDRIRAAKAKGLWTFPRKCALRGLMDADRRLNAADQKVGWAMLEAVRNEKGLCYLASDTIARQTGLHPVTARASRRNLIDLGYFLEVRPGGQNRATVCAPNHRLVEAIPASAASSNPDSDRVREVFAPPPAANDDVRPQVPDQANERPQIVASPTTVILTSGGGSQESSQLKDLFGAAPDRLSFGRWVRERRLSLGLSQRALAREISCSQSHVANVERGHDSLGPWSMQRLRELFGAVA